jgi:hypothetical protein
LSLSCQRLDELHDYLLSRDELLILHKLQLGLCTSDCAPDTANTWAVSLVSTFQQWIHLRNVVSEAPALLDSFAAMETLLEPLAHLELQALRASVDAAVTAFAGRDLTATPISALWDASVLAAKVSPRLFGLPARLVQQLGQAEAFFAWLQTMSSDVDFSTSLDMAINRTEMDCPPELWDSVACRPSERKLAQLNHVRSQLYDFVYRTGALFSGILALVATLPAAPAERIVISAHLGSCLELQQPFMDIMADQCTNQTDTLLRLLQPQSASRWQCTLLDTTDSRGDVEMAYTAPSGEARVYPLNELLDFQTSVTLSTSRMGSLVVAQAVDRFNQQFSWMQAISAALKDLQRAGHVDFRTAKVTYSMLETEPDTMRDQAFELKALLASWVTEVQHVRIMYPCLNVLTLRQLWRLYDHIVTAKSDASLESFDQVFEQTYSILGAGPPAAAKTVSDVFAKSLVKIWPAVDLSVAGEKLRSLGNALTTTFSSCNFAPVRSIVPPTSTAEAATQGEEGGSGVDINSVGVSLVCVGSDSEILDMVLSLFARQGLFPERVFCLLCTSATSLEEAINLIYRWALCPEGDAPRLFCLAGFEKLDFSVQRELAELIQLHLPRATCPLALLVVGESSHLAAQFLHVRVHPTLLHAAVLRTVLVQLSSRHPAGLRVYVLFHFYFNKKIVFSEFFFFAGLRRVGLVVEKPLLCA